MRPNLLRVVNQITPLGRHRIDPPNRLRRAAPRPLAFRQRPQPLRPSLGLGPVASSSRRQVSASFLGPGRGQWRAHHATGRCPALTAAFVPPHGIGTQQPQGALGTVCCRHFRVRRCPLRDQAPSRALDEVVTGLGLQNSASRAAPPRPPLPPRQCTHPGCLVHSPMPQSPRPPPSCSIIALKCCISFWCTTN